MIRKSPPRPALIPTTKDAYALFHRGALALARIEANGVRINTERLEKHIRETEQKVAEIETSLKADPLFKVWRKEYGASSNLASDPQLAHVLYDCLKIPCVAWTAGGESGKRKPSVSEKALQSVDHPFVKSLFEARHLKKTVGTFLKGMRREVVDGYLHPFFDLHTVVSYRSSSSSVNFQNMPKRDESLAKLVRRCVVAREGCHFWEIDFRGSEVCTNAVINQDPVLLNYVRTNPGAMHADAAAELFFVEPGRVTKRVRSSVKNLFVFASFYGSYYRQTAKDLWEEINRDKTLTAWEGGPWLVKHLAENGVKGPGAFDPDARPVRGTFEAHVRDVEDALWRRFSVYHQWRKDHWASYQEKGYFDLPTGFRIQWGKGGSLDRNDAICYPAQGSSFHCLLFTLIKLQEFIEREKLETRIVGQVHDSIEGDSPPGELPVVLDEANRIIAEDLPRHWPWLVVPMIVEISASPGLGGSWWSMKSWEKRGGVWGPV